MNRATNIYLEICRWFAATGFICSSFLYLFSWFGWVPFGSYYLVLFLGIVILFFPALAESWIVTYGYKRYQWWYALTLGCNKIERYLTYGSFLFAILNMLILVIEQSMFPNLPTTKISDPASVRLITAFILAFFSFFYSLFRTSQYRRRKGIFNPL